MRGVIVNHHLGMSDITSIFRVKSLAAHRKPLLRFFSQHVENPALV